jgi:hypothetical protein
MRKKSPGLSAGALSVSGNAGWERQFDLSRSLRVVPFDAEVAIPTRGIHADAEEMRGLVIQLQRMNRRHERLRLAGENPLSLAYDSFGKCRGQRMLQEITQRLNVSAQKRTAK